MTGGIPSRSPKQETASGGDSHVRFGGSAVNPATPMTSSGIQDNSQIVTIDFGRIDADSTYSALSSAVKLLQEKGRRHSDFVSKAELEVMIYEFERRKVDLSNVMGFPYDADDLDDCLQLLARLQNRMAMKGAYNTDCTLRDIMEDALLDRENKNHRYDIGEWVEVRGPSMKYRLERIEDVIRTNGDEGDDDQYVYETSVDHQLAEESIRWPREGLRRVFGMGPWAWRQWACVKLENKLRFQVGHPDDLQLLDIRAYAIELWELWLADPRNKSFQELFERVGESGQNELIHHIMTPFNLMHNIATNMDDNWELEDSGVSLFTYVSLLGSGFFDAFIVLALQVSIPIILYVFYTDASAEAEAIAIGTRPLLFSVLIYYIYKVYQDLWVNFNQIAGLSTSVISRIQSLRRISWVNGTDSWSQSAGYTLDLFMNTGYLCILNLFNIFILFKISDPFEILGSVIFFEFLFDIDEEVASASWWDHRQRYLKTGLISTVLSNTIREDCLSNSKSYLDKMCATMTEAERQEVEKKFAAAQLPKDYDFLHGTESKDGHFLLTVAERVERLRQIESKAVLSDEFDESEKPQVSFRGFLSSEFTLFERHADRRCWSQWEVVLFSFPTPTLVPPGYVEGAKLVIPDDIGDQDAIRRKAAPGKTTRQRFSVHVKDVLSCVDFGRLLRKTHRKSWWFFYTRVLHSLVAWISYFIQFLFLGLALWAAVTVCLSEYYCWWHAGETSTLINDTCVQEEL